MTTAALPAVRPAAPRPAWFGGNMPVARWGVILNLLVPVTLLAWDAWHAKLGADAIHVSLHTTGQIAVIYLAMSLAVTPLRQVTGWSWLVQFRRAIGVYAFYYAAVHLAIYFWWDRGGSVSGTVSEIVHRYYLAIGFASLALMVPLWATSFDAAIRRMGGKNWKRLHRLAYVAAILAGVHYYLQSKSYKFKPEVYLAVVGGLLAWRGVAAVVTLARRPAMSGARGFPMDAADGATAKSRFWKGDLRVIGTFDETPTVRTFRLAPPDGGPLPFTYAAGQFLNLTLTIDGESVNRSYTIASSPTRDHAIELTVKREQHGRASHYLHDRLSLGQFVRVSAPAGRFTFDARAETAVLLIAGGVGVTPVMSILRDLTDRCWPGRIDLIFSVRTPDDVIFAAELKLLAARHANLTVHRTFTRAAPEDGSGSRGRVTAELLKRLVPDVAARRAFICGPDEMAKAVREELRSAGVADDRITTESFTPAAATPASPATGRASATTATVTFVPSNTAAPLAANQTVLEAAEAAGVPIDYQCRSGVCGTCRCRLLEGVVTMAARDALSDADEAEGYILTCQAHAEGDITIMV